MFERRSIKWPIILGVVMIVLVVVLTVGWVLLAMFGAHTNAKSAGLYWTMLSVGTTLLAFMLVGVVMYLILSIKAINLSRRQSNFIDSVTHELKSPIASLKLYLQTLNRHQVSKAEQEDFYRYILEDVERLDSLINHLLDTARLEHVPSRDEADDVPLAAVLRRCAEEVCLRYQVPPEVIRLELTPCIVRARQVDLELIFRNLLDNAVKYSADEDPQVEVLLRPAGHARVLVRVSDNGRGIPAQQRRKIYGRFVRLGSELERDKPGTGLGLHIVRTLIARLRGAIRVRDRGELPGTIFEVILPGNPVEEPATVAASNDQ
jgi:signal transduction histidine kinase